MNRKKIIFSLAVIAMTNFTGIASAAPSYCSDGLPHADGLTLNDVTYNGSDADDCYGAVAGNDSNTPINGLGLTWGSDWTFLAKDDGPGVTSNGTYAGIDFSLTSAAGSSGDWTLTGTGAVPATLDFVIALKASDSFGLWLLDDVLFDGNDSGTWTINYVNNGGKIPNLSHMSLYVRNGEDPQNPNEVPEPLSLLLISSGLMGFAFIRRRKS